MGFVSLGCPKNLVDSEVMMGLLSRPGPNFSRAEDADVIVVNTCSFIASAKQESVDTILEMASTRARGAPANWWSRAAWWNAFAMRSARTSRKSMRWSEQESWREYSQPPESLPPGR